MIYIATHKKYDYVEMEGFKPLQVGAALHDDLGYLKDNVGESISEKNPNFCELTGLYWIWKNTSDDYKGLAHYRRFFGKNKIEAHDSLVSKLDSADIILPKVSYFKENARNQMLRSSVTLKNLEAFEKLLFEMYPDYKDTYIEYSQGNTSSLFNMMFCKAELFDSYCEWLFNFMFEYEKYVDLTDNTDYQKRIYGFISERMLNLYVMKNNLKVCYSDVYSSEMSTFEKINAVRRDITNNIIFKVKR